MGSKEGLSQYGSLEAQATEFARYTLAPWFAKWELEAEKKLLKVNDRKIIEFDTSGLLRSDHKTRFSIYRVGRDLLPLYEYRRCRKRRRNNARKY
jgi:phage portal protein BeeE